MKKRILLLITAVLLFISLSACGEDRGATYIEGSYMNEDLHVGYNFFSNGEGYQFISGNAFLMKYKIKDGNITITTLTEPKVTETFVFEQYSESIIIGGIIYVLVKDETPSGAIPYK